MITFPRLSQAGRLGNQLWQVASTIGIAASRGDASALPENWDYRPFFMIPDSHFGPQIGLDAGNLPEHIDERTRVYLQDFGLFKGVEWWIKELLRFSPHAVEIATNEASVPLWEYPRPWTSVHVRRGDNVTHPPGWHPLRSRTYYETAIRKLPSDGTVIVFSDDPNWCRENMTEWLGRDILVYDGVTRPREYVDRQLYESSPVLDWIDLYFMTLCDHHILANSSYSWWGAFLSNNRHPIYPSRWFGRNLPYVNASLMFPDGWIEVDDPTQGGA